MNALPKNPLPPTPDVPPGYTPEDDHMSELRDDWRAEEREWMDDFRERCREP